MHVSLIQQCPSSIAPSSAYFPQFCVSRATFAQIFEDKVYKERVLLFFLSVASQD